MRVLIERAASDLAGDPAFVAAVIAVESSGSAVLPSGRAITRFEGAIFSRLTNHRFDQSHPHLSMRSWRRNNDFVRGGEEEWERIEEAALLDREAAYKSASYALFQIMGFHAERLGFADVFNFVDAMNSGIQSQFDIFVRFIKADSRLLQAIRSKDAMNFALYYNGKGNVPYYSRRITEEYAKKKQEWETPLPSFPLPRRKPHQDEPNTQKQLGNFIVRLLKSLMAIIGGSR